jgi:hypothetical protein
MEESRVGPIKRNKRRKSLLGRRNATTCEVSNNPRVARYNTKFDFTEDLCHDKGTGYFVTIP